MVHNGAICNQSTPYEADFRLDCLRKIHRGGHVLLTMRELSCMVGRTQSGLWTARLQGFMYLGQLGAGAAGAVCTSAGICRILFPAKTLRKLTACRLCWSRGHELTLAGASCVVEIILLIW